MQEVAAGFLGRVATVSFGCDCFVALPLQKDCMPASFCFCTMDLRSNYWHHQQHVPLYHTKFKFHRLPQRRITRPALEPRHSASNMSTVHLVVLQHGLWGSPADVANLTSYLEKALAQQPTHEDEELALLKSAVNAKRLTYDGIDVCGARLAQLVQDTIQQYADGGKKVTKLSMIGYSLGGVISRFAAGKLYVAGLFDEVQPMNLITIASPHLGSFREPRGLWARFFNSQVPIIASRSGRQLMLVDTDYSVPWLTQQQELHNKASKQHHESFRSQQNGQQQQEQQGVVHLEQIEVKEQQQAAASSNGVGEPTNLSSSSRRGDSGKANEQQQQQQSESSPGSGGGGSKLDQQQRGVVLPPGVDPDQAVPLLLLMAHPAGPFWRALRHFKTRICAANIRYDTMVPYCTAALRITNPYEQAEPLPIDPEKYPSIVRPATPEEESQIVPVPVRGRSRLFFLAVFVPMFPFFYLYSVTNGFWHHRQARRRPLDLTWLQQYTVDHNPFSRQVSRRPSQKLRHTAGYQQQWQRQQQQRLSAAAKILEVEAAEVRAADNQESPAAAPAPAGKQISNRPSVSPGSRSSRSTAGSPTPAAAAGFSQISPFSAAAGGDQQQHQHSKDGSLSPPRSIAAAAAAAVPHISATMSLERALTSEGVLERDGIIEDPWIVHQQQQWMAQQLFDNLPPCWIPERTTPSSSTKIQGDLTGGSTSGSGSEYKASSSSTVIAEAPAAAAEVKSRSEAETVLTTVQPEPQQQQQQQQQGSNSTSSHPTSPITAPEAAASGSGSGGSGFKSQGGWHRLDVWMGHMHAHAAIMLRDKRYEAESPDMFQYLVDHMNL